MARLFTKTKLSYIPNICTFTMSAIQNGQNKIMKKILSGNAKKKHQYTDAPVHSSPSEYTKGASEGRKSVNSRRALVLNKLFMRHITDLMATGESSNLFVGYGIEVNRVRVTPDFQAVHVYWLAKGTQQDDVVDQILNDHAGHLRHELNQLRVIGNVPKIVFFKDKKFAQLMEIDLRLAVADFGEDYIPTEMSSKLKSQLKLHISLDPHIKDKIKELDTQITMDEPDGDIPPMPQNVLGLNHSDIMERVSKSMTKSLVMHRLQPKNPDDQTQEMLKSFNDTPMEFANMKSQREAFKEFLIKRQLMKVKANRELKNLRPELDYLQEEWESKNQSTNEFQFFDENDYIDEEEEK